VSDQQREYQEYQERLARAERAEAARQRLLEGARNGEFYSVGEEAAKLLLAEEQQRQVQAIRQQAVADYLSLEQQRKQAAVDQEAAAYSADVLDAAQRRLESDPDFDPRSFDAAASRWRRYAREEAERERGHRLTDADIARMEPAEWERVYDVDQGRFKAGYTYEPGEESGYGGINAAAAGLGGTSLDLTRYRP